MALINNRETTSHHMVRKIIVLSVDFPPHTVRDFGAFEIRRMLDDVAAMSKITGTWGDGTFNYYS